MSDLICLDKIVGLSRNTCECYENDRPNDYDESNSGLFLDEVEGLELRVLSGDSDCDDGNIWQRMDRAIENAKLMFRTDLLAAIGQNSKSKRKATNTVVGELGYKSFITPVKTFYGTKICKANIKGGEFTLKGISALFDTTVVFSLEIWNNIQDTPLLVLPNLNANIGSWTDNILSPDPLLTFPLYSEDEEELEYYFVYNPVGFRPANNNATCGCSRRPDWEKWVDYVGISGNDMENAELFQTSSYANGLRLNIQFNCNNSHVICGGKNEEFDFDNNPIARVMAYAIRYKAAQILIDDILGSGVVNRYTLLDSERLRYKRNDYAAEYSQRIMYLQGEIDINTNDCLTCSDNSISRRAILS